METQHYTAVGYETFLKVFTIVAGWVVAATAVYMLFGLFSQFLMAGA